MKLQISFDQTDLDHAIENAKKVSDFADILEVGSTLIYKYGLDSVKKFKENFPQKTIYADIKLVDRVEDIIDIFVAAGANIISILAGTNNKTILKATQIAHKHKCQIALDLVDAYSIGQSAMDSKTLEVDFMIFHGPHETTMAIDMLDEWQNIRENTQLPIFVSGGINRINIQKILELKPQGVIIGAAITDADNPAKEAEFFKSLL